MWCRVVVGWVVGWVRVGKGGGSSVVGMGMGVG